jgi:hypothetical protein
MTAFGVDPLPEGYHLARISRGRAQLVFDGQVVGRVIRKRRRDGRVGTTWGFTFGPGRRLIRGGFYTRAAGVGVPDKGGDQTPRGQAFIVFTLRDGKIIRIQDYLTHAEALTAAGAQHMPDWH